MAGENKEEVKRLFGAHASNYVTSTIHANGSDLANLADLAELTGKEQVLDIATGAGHTALALAPRAGQVIGIDITPEMLSEARQQALALGIANVTFQEADAENLPFPDNRFDVVTCRIAAHHFPHVTDFCREVTRVLRPGGCLLLVDNVVYEEADLDSLVNTVEKLRDPSHFRAYRLTEWEAVFTEAGLSFAVARTFETTISLTSWLNRMGAPTAVKAEVRRLLAEAPAEAREKLQITPESFSLQKAIMVGIKSA